MPSLQRNASMKQLRIFAAAARHRSFMAAAKELHLSQPAVSMQMAKLAESLETELFTKSGRQIELTEAGEVLWDHVLKALQNLSDAKAALDNLKGVHSGRIKIAITTTARYFIPKLIKQFNDIHADIEVQMEVMNRAQVVDSLATGAVDLAIMGRPPKRITVHSEVFAEHPYVIVAHPQHPLVGKTRISPADIAGEVFLQREDGSGTRKLMHYFFASNDIVSPRGNVVGGNESIKQSVMAGLGIAFISRHTISHELAANRLATLQVKNLPIIRTWNLIRPVNKTTSAITQSLVDFIKTEAPAELADM